MSKTSIRIKTRQQGEITEVKLLITHPMETGIRIDKRDGSTVPAHFIKEVHCEHNGEWVFKTHWGPAVAKNPFLLFRFTGAKVGDKIHIHWIDNKGKSDSLEASLD